MCEKEPRYQMILSDINSNEIQNQLNYLDALKKESNSSELSGIILLLTTIENNIENENCKKYWISI